MNTSSKKYSSWNPEAAKALKEGFDSAFELHNNSRNHSIYERVIIHHYPGHGFLKDKQDYIQGVAYTDCISAHKSRMDHVALIDTDEFLVPQQQQPKTKKH